MTATYRELTEAAKRRAELRLLKLLRKVDAEVIRPAGVDEAGNPHGPLVNVSLLADVREALKRFDARYGRRS